MGLAPLFDTERYAAMDRWHTVQCAAHLELLDQVAAMDETEGWTFDGANSMAHWLVNRYRLSHRTANEWVRVAHKIQGLPALRETYRSGRMSWDQLRAATCIATPDTDDELAAEAPGLSVRELNRKASELTLRDVEKVHRDRSVAWSFDDSNPVLRFQGEMVDTDGVELVKTLTRMASQAPPLEDGSYEPFQARCLDALLQLASQQRGADSDPDRATAVIHIPLSVLTDNADGHNRAVFEDGTKVLAETAARLLCDARIQINLEDLNGTVVGVGRTSRTVPSWLARIIRQRDQGCRFPGCGRTRWVHIHHIIHWVRGGPTDLDNLITLCLYHHRLVHESGWTITGDPNHQVTWHRPSGSVFTPGWAYNHGCQHGILQLEDAHIPDRLRKPKPPDTS
jgi:hypothetical protein